MTSDNNNGFAKLNEEMNTSRRGSFYPNNSQTQPIFPVFGFGVSTRIRMGKFEFLAERDDGSLRIGNLTFANNCHIILLVFGGFFLLAGIILTSLSYRSRPNSEIGNQDYSRVKITTGSSDIIIEIQTQKSFTVPIGRDLNSNSGSSPGFESSRDEGRLAGPIFIIIGFVLMTSGLALTFVSCKLNEEAKRVEAFSSMNSHRSASNDLGNPQIDEMIGNAASSSIFGGRRATLATLPTISQTFPFYNGRLPDGQKRKNSSPPAFSPASSTPRDGVSPTATRKLSLAMRPSIQSIPITLMSSPSFISRSRIVAPLEESLTPDHDCITSTSSGFIFPLSVSRSDQPFGSIASLSSGHHCIATFPQFNAVQSPSNSNKASQKDKSDFEQENSEHDDDETNIAITEGEKSFDLLSNLSKSTQDQVQDHQSQKGLLTHGLVDEESPNFLHSIHSRGLPTIRVDEDQVNPLNSSKESIFPAISTNTASIYADSPIILTSTNTPV